MEFIFELIIEVVLGLVTDSGVEIMTGSEETKKWPKPVRIFCVVTTIILSATVIGFLLVYGIILMIKGHVAVGILLFTGKKTRFPNVHLFGAAEVIIVLLDIAYQGANASFVLPALNVAVIGVKMYSI
ncbi:MAG: hypothetical protein IKS85_05165, partial [Lachnospiraceae bacterium]|nr:hypothetical protein [Lachnospiraceae bacterium]